jgi:hypothetical protein
MSAIQEIINRLSNVEDVVEKLSTYDQNLAIGVSGSGAAFQVAYWVSTAEIAGDPGVQLDAANNRIDFANDGGVGNALGARLLFNSAGGTFYAYFADCHVGIGDPTPDEAMLVIRQVSAPAAIPVLLLDQDDEDEPFYKVEGHGANDCTLNLSDTTPTWTLEGYYRIEVLDDNAVIAAGDYWVPFYSCS